MLLRSKQDKSIEHACNELSFHLKVSWWIAKQILSGSISFSSDNSYAKDILDLLHGNRSSQSGQPLQQISSIILQQLDKHSIPHIILPWLSTVDENELMDLLQKRPVANNALHIVHTARKDIETSIVRGYYAIRALLSILIKSNSWDSMQLERNTNSAPQQYSSDMEECVVSMKDNVCGITSPTVRLTLLEDMFNLLFLRKEHVHIHSDDKNQENSDITFIATAHVMEMILESFDICLTTVEKDSTVTTDVKSRHERMRTFIEDAQWRMQMARWILHTDEQEMKMRNQPRYMDSIQLMLSSPRTLLSIALKKKDFKRASDIVERYKDAFTRSDLHEIEISQQISNLHLPQELQACHVSEWFDILISIKKDQHNVISRCEDIFLKNCRNDEQRGMVFRLSESLRGLAATFESVPLRTTLRKLFLSYTGFPDMIKFLCQDDLDEYLDGRRKWTKSIRDLHEATISANISRGDIALLVDAVLDKTQAQNGQYLYHFLKYTTQIAEVIFQDQSGQKTMNRNELTTLFNRGPVESIAQFIFQDHACK